MYDTSDWSGKVGGAGSLDNGGFDWRDPAVAEAVAGRLLTFTSVFGFGPEFWVVFYSTSRPGAAAAPQWIKAAGMESPNLGDNEVPSVTAGEILVPDPPWDRWQVFKPLSSLRGVALVWVSLTFNTR